VGKVEVVMKQDLFDVELMMVDDSVLMDDVHRFSDNSHIVVFVVVVRPN
jgi:hypothetical protein